LGFAQKGFFDNIYALSDDMLDGNSSVLQINPSTKYKLRFFAALDENKEYKMQNS